MSFTFLLTAGFPPAFTLFRTPGVMPPVLLIPGEAVSSPTKPLVDTLAVWDPDTKVLSLPEHSSPGYTLFKPVADGHMLSGFAVESVRGVWARDCAERSVLVDNGYIYLREVSQGGAPCWNPLADTTKAWPVSTQMLGTPSRYVHRDGITVELVYRDFVNALDELRYVDDSYLTKRLLADKPKKATYETPKLAKNEQTSEEMMAGEKIATDKFIDRAKATVKEETAAALWRAGAVQTTRTARDLFFAAAKKAMPRQKLALAQMKRLAETSVGEAVCSYALGLALEIRAAADPRRKRLASELRIAGEAGALNGVLDPIRVFLTSGIDQILDGLDLPEIPEAIPETKTVGAPAVVFDQQKHGEAVPVSKG